MIILINLHSTVALSCWSGNNPTLQTSTLPLLPLTPNRTVESKTFRIYTPPQFGRATGVLVHPPPTLNDVFSSARTPFTRVTPPAGLRGMKRRAPETIKTLSAARLSRKTNRHRQFALLRPGAPRNDTRGMRTVILLRPCGWLRSRVVQKRGYPSSGWPRIHLFVRIQGGRSEVRSGKERLIPRSRKCRLFTCG